MADETTSTLPEKKLTKREADFVAAYVAGRCRNAAAAARAAGYSERSVYDIASQNLRKLHIQEAIAELLTAEHMTPEEVLYHLGDEARSTMNDFLTLRPQRVATTVTKPVATVIADLQDHIDFEEEYARRAGLADDELKAHDAEIARLRRRILRLELRRERDPDATEDVPGPIVEQLVPDVDLAKAAERGKLHLVKSYNAKDGKIELYDAHASLVDIGKHHGLFKDVVEIQIPWDDLTPEQLQRIRDGEDPKAVLRDR